MVEGKSEASNTFAARERFYPLLDLNKEFTFDTFVEGRSNQIARAAALQVSENIGGSSYNPLLLYGGVGLGKTHLMHAVGNSIADRHPNLKVLTCTRSDLWKTWSGPSSTGPWVISLNTTVCRRALNG